MTFYDALGTRAAGTPAIDLSEQKRRLRAAFSELKSIPVLLERNGATPLAAEFRRVVDCLRRHGIELGDEMSLYWDAILRKWEIK